ncbi:MAG: glycosyltransferase family 2 protein [Candidatus Kapabacteria bacterium]|jgi:glycosyltransferase involved in cell wall biosynthesis|nr:glycosyltransferase family 2 protein [Candidatus Kapabacteria bacterium]
MNNPNAAPFFSVIICTYNRAHLLPRALDSLLAQTETDWEAIIVDDGSTDGTEEVIQHYCPRYPNFSTVYHTNHGLVYSRNVGINLAKGRFVTILDSDDYYLLNHLELRKNILTKNHTIDFLHGGVEIIGDPFVPDRHNPRNMIHLQDCVVGGTFCIKRQVLLSLGGFPNGDYGTDAALFEQALQQNNIIIEHTNLSTYVYVRTEPDSMCNLATAS